MVVGFWGCWRDCASSSGGGWLKRCACDFLQVGWEPHDPCTSPRVFYSNKKLTSAGTWARGTGELEHEAGGCGQLQKDSGQWRFVTRAVVLEDGSGRLCRRIGGGGVVPARGRGGAGER